MQKAPTEFIPVANVVSAPSPLGAVRSIGRRIVLTVLSQCTERVIKGRKRTQNRHKTIQMASDA